ncbi:hypothetical protein F2Q69_00050361 [Brassica cretica]|uniref:Uncharacterized protein n=1 Tax=Brassica cretica TaxID=69181 RepID=A0A8S9PYY2_BRACR|nr:hypothetical protein F2Q69_00050361 [Brassica cretica]
MYTVNLSKKQPETSTVSESAPPAIKVVREDQVMKPMPSSLMLKTQPYGFYPRSPTDQSLAHYLESPYRELIPDNSAHTYQLNFRCLFECW